MCMYLCINTQCIHLSEYFTCTKKFLLQLTKGGQDQITEDALYIYISTIQRRLARRDGLWSEEHFMDTACVAFLSAIIACQRCHYLAFTMHMSLRKLSVVKNLLILYRAASYRYWSLSTTSTHIQLWLCTTPAFTMSKTLFTWLRIRLEQ